MESELKRLLGSGLSEDLIVAPRGLFFLDVVRGPVLIFGLADMSKDQSEDHEPQLAWNDERPDDSEIQQLIWYE